MAISVPKLSCDRCHLLEVQLDFFQTALRCQTQELEQKSKWIYLQQLSLWRREEKLAKRERDVTEMQEEAVAQLEIAREMKMNADGMMRNVSNRSHLASSILSTLTRLKMTPMKSAKENSQKATLRILSDKTALTGSNNSMSPKEHPTNEVSSPSIETKDQTVEWSVASDDPRGVMAPGYSDAKTEKNMAEGHYSAENIQLLLETLTSRTNDINPGENQLPIASSTNSSPPILIDLTDSITVECRAFGEQETNVAKGSKHRQVHDWTESQRSDAPISKKQSTIAVSTQLQSCQSSFATQPSISEVSRNTSNREVVETQKAGQKDEVLQIKSTGNGTHSTSCLLLKRSNVPIKTEKIPYYRSSERKSGQYNIDYLLKLGKQCTAPIAPDFRFKIEDIRLGNSRSPPEVYWYFEFPFEGHKHDDQALILRLLKALHSPRNPQMPEFHRRRTLLVSGSGDFADLLAEQITELGQGLQVAVVHEDRGAQDNKNQAASFRNGARNIMACSIAWAEHFLEDKIGQIILHRLKGSGSARESVKATKEFLANIQRIKDSLTQSIMVRVIFSPDEKRMARVLASELRTIKAECVTPLSTIEKHFPK